MFEIKPAEIYTYSALYQVLTSTTIYAKGRNSALCLFIRIHNHIHIYKHIHNHNHMHNRIHKH